MVKHLLAIQKNLGSIPGSGRSWRRKWQPTPVFLPGEFHGQKSLVGYSPWDCKELDMTEKHTHPWILNILKNNHFHIFVSTKIKFSECFPYRTSCMKLLIFSSSLISRLGKEWTWNIDRGREKDKQNIVLSSVLQTVGHYSTFRLKKIWS